MKRAWNLNEKASDRQWEIMRSWDLHTDSLKSSCREQGIYVKIEWD